MFAAPTILAPIARQSFFAQSPIPIKLALPQGWGATGYYAVNIGRKDQTGNWASPLQFSVSVVDAQSQSGFTGFGGALGGGVIGPYTSTPGSWHLRAQVASPRVSDWSDWVEFTVTAPPAAAVKGTLKGGFGK